MTVSRVINGRYGVDVATQRKVEEAIEALDYIPNRIARGLTSQKTATIGLVVPDVVNPFFSPVVRGAEKTARKAGYRVLLCNTEGDLRLERDYIEDLVAHRVEGLLWRRPMMSPDIVCFRFCAAGFRSSCSIAPCQISIVISSPATDLPARAGLSSISSS